MSILLSTARIVVEPDHVSNRVTPAMVGACIEDVNHEIYGGLYAQRLFGESFEEPSDTIGSAGWRSFGGSWVSEGTVVMGAAGDGPKLVLPHSPANGAIEADVQVRGQGDGNVGLLVRVSEAGVGADRFDGYEISLDGNAHRLILGKHRQDFRSLVAVPAPVSVGEWHRLRVETAGVRLRISLDDERVPRIDYTDSERPLLKGGIALRTWQVDAAFRDVRIDGAPIPLDVKNGGVSGMWDSIGQGTFALDGDAYNGTRCQRIVNAGAGVAGVANRGLNRWGIAVQAGRPMDGRVYLHGDVAEALVALQSADGARTYASQRLPVGASWRKVPFRLTPNATDPNARFVILTDRKGTLWADQAVLLAPNLYKGLPVREDIAQGLLDEGVTFLRYGGTMINAPEYRWKKMIGDPDLRPPYRGHWYPYSTNGFGIFEFLSFCEKAKLGAAFAINVEETPEDAADLVDYLTAPATSEWGRRRAEDGHPEPYRFEYLEIGNEEGLPSPDRAAMTHYAERFRVLSKAIHARDPKIRLVCAAWWMPDADFMKTVFDAVDGVATAWDIHVGSDEADAGASIDRDLDRAQRLFKDWNPNTKLKAVIFEENGGRHDLQRALGHATTVNVARRHGDFVLADCAANALQPWLQNDNGWDQGQIFFTPDHVWQMPPAYANRMLADDYLPLHVKASTDGELDLYAAKSEDGRTLALTVVNPTGHAVTTTIDLGGFEARTARVRTLQGDPTAANPPSGAPTVVPREENLDADCLLGGTTFPAHSLTSIRLRR